MPPFRIILYTILLAHSVVPDGMEQRMMLKRSRCFPEMKERLLDFFV